jgi:hypothetical protein
VGDDRIVGALANLGLRLSDQTVGNILRRHDIPPAPKRKRTTSWKDFIRAHMAVLVATDFFTVEVLTLTGLITHYVLFFIHLESRRICLAGVTRHPDQEWMEQMVRNVTMEDSGFLIHRKYLLHDHDSKYCSSAPIQKSLLWMPGISQRLQLGYGVGFISTFHTFAVLSQLAVANRFPSGLQATLSTTSLWPERVNNCLAVSLSHTFATRE